MIPVIINIVEKISANIMSKITKIHHHALRVVNKTPPTNNSDVVMLKIIAIGA